MFRTAEDVANGTDVCGDDPLQCNKFSDEQRENAEAEKGDAADGSGKVDGGEKLGGQEPGKEKGGEGDGVAKDQKKEESKPSAKPDDDMMGLEDSEVRKCTLPTKFPSQSIPHCLLNHDRGLHF